MQQPADNLKFGYFLDWRFQISKWKKAIITSTTITTTGTMFAEDAFRKPLAIFAKSSIFDL